MKQGQVIEAATRRFASDERLKGLFLSGSFGNGTEDAWSDVDFLVIVEDDKREAIKADFLDTLESVGTLISSNTMEVGATLVNTVLEDWTRCDMVLADERALAGKARDGLKPLIDPGDLWSGLPETLEWRGPNPHKVEFLVKEFTRVLGLLSVVHGRDEIATAMTGAGLQRTNLIALMTEAVPMVDTGGILHMTKIFPADHQRAVLALPVAEANWPSIIEAHRACAAAFYPLARNLMKDAGGTWPDRFIEVTRAHLLQEIGSDLIGG